MNRNGARVVVWLSRGGNLIRGAPGRLRYAADAECALFEHQRGTVDLPRISDVDKASISMTWGHRLNPNRAMPRKETM
eukprot:9635607-Lingulodinium_polyedra.AAC.1